MFYEKEKPCIGDREGAAGMTAAISARRLGAAVTMWKTRG